jgi:hypothetical protein
VNKLSDKISDKVSERKQLEECFETIFGKDTAFVLPNFTYFDVSLTVENNKISNFNYMRLIRDLFKIEFLVTDFTFHCHEIEFRVQSKAFNLVNKVIGRLIHQVDILNDNLDDLSKARDKEQLALCPYCKIPLVVSKIIHCSQCNQGHLFCSKCHHAFIRDYSIAGNNLREVLL